MNRLLCWIAAGVLVAACGESRIEKHDDEPLASEPAVEKREPASGGASGAVEHAEPPAGEPGAVAEPPSSAGDAATPGPTAHGAQGAEVADVILIVPLGGSKKSISFPHKMHADAELNPVVGGKCHKCHHEAKDGAKERKCTTAGCHDDMTEDVPKAKDSFHKTCRDGCHKEVREADPGNEKLQALRACKGCHSH